MSEQCSPLAALVMCMIVLSVFGTLVGGLHWYTVDRPNEEKMLSTPQNSFVHQKEAYADLSECLKAAAKEETVCMASCTAPTDLVTSLAQSYCQQGCKLQSDTNYQFCKNVFSGTAT